MRAVVQRVSRASVRVQDETTGEIRGGLLVLVGVERGDTERAADWLARKIAGLRMFEAAAGSRERSVLEAGGSVLAVSQFTLLGDCRKGRRPSFTRAAPGPEAEALYDRFCRKLRQAGLPVETGRFGARMAVSLVNEGPFTLLIESPR